MRLSIITVNLNNKEGLRKTLISITGQTFRGYELIIIDGGSVDGSAELIADYSSNVSFWVSEPDKGIYNAMNKGILKANGDYCFFLNSGDYLVNNKVLEEVFREDHDSDLVHGNLIVVSEKNDSGVIKGKESLSFLDIYSSAIKQQASFIKRTLFEKFGLFDDTLVISADWAFFIKSIGLGGATCRYIDTDIAYFDNNGISNNNPEICQAEETLILDKYLPKMMQEDYRLMKKFRGIREIEKSGFAWFFYRILVRAIKALG